MNIKYRIEGSLDGPCVMAIGNFDGVHLGHQFLLHEAKVHAKRLGLPLVAATFDPHPREYLDCAFRASRIMPARTNGSLLLQSGADTVVTFTFDHALANMTAASFCEDVLLSLFQVRCLFMGRDFCLGAKREGNFEFLKRFGTPRGMTVVVVETLLSGGATISSTRIRRLLFEGDITGAEDLMGRSFDSAALGTPHDAT